MNFALKVLEYLFATLVAIVVIVMLPFILLAGGLIYPFIILEEKINGRKHIE